MWDRVLARHPVALAGVVVTTVSAIGFLALFVAHLFGLFTNPYAGLVIFVALPAIFVLGLLAIPLGMWLERRRLARHPGATAEWFVIDFRSKTVRRRALLILALTTVNVVIVLVAGYGSLHSMESPQFCGQTCHTPMHPQYTAWQNAPHSQVTCVQCHVGEGGRAFLKYKMSGVRQLYHVVTDHYPRPIPGVADMRPAQEVCGTCHWSKKGFGDIVQVKRDYADDEMNTETMTILQTFLGGPGEPTPSGRAIHWHADPGVKIDFIYTDQERQTIPFVKYTDAQGNVREYATPGTTPEQLAKGTARTMDCVDCHNTVAHRIAATPEQAVNDALAAGQIDRTLPFAKREAVRLIKASYPTSEDAARVIDKDLREFYMSRGHAGDDKVTKAVAAVQGIYGRNVFPTMKVTFGTYPDNIGHINSSGCFRCHDGSLTAKDGSTIGADCEYCHKMIDRPSQP